MIVVFLGFGVGWGLARNFFFLYFSLCELRNGEEFCSGKLSLEGYKLFGG